MEYYLSLLVDYHLNQGKAAASQLRKRLKFRPVWMLLKRGIVIFRSGKDFQLPFKIVKLGLKASDAQLPSPGLNCPPITLAF